MKRKEGKRVRRGLPCCGRDLWVPFPTAQSTAEGPRFGGDEHGVLARTPGAERVRFE